MTRQLGTHVACEENPGLIANTTHMVAHNPRLQFQEIWRFLLTSQGTRHTPSAHAGKTPKQIKYINL